MKLLLCGGGSSVKVKKSYQVFSNIIDHNKPVLYIPLAMTKERYPSCLEWITSELKEYEIDKIEMVRSAKELSKKNFKNYSALYIGGGNTYKLLNELKSNNCFEKINQYIHSNGIIFGSSAGAIIFGYDINSCSFMDKNDVKLTDPLGFNVLNGMSITAHYSNQDKKATKEATVYLKQFSKINTIIALPEEDSIYINDDEITIIGDKKYYLFQNGKIQKCNN